MENRTHHLNVNISVSSVRGAFAPLRAFRYYRKLTYNPPVLTNRLKYTTSPTPQRAPEVAHRASRTLSLRPLGERIRSISDFQHPIYLLEPDIGHLPRDALFHTSSTPKPIHAVLPAAAPRCPTPAHAATSIIWGKSLPPSYLAHRKTVGCCPRFPSFHISSLTVGI